MVSIYSTDSPFLAALKGAAEGGRAQLDAEKSKREEARQRAALALQAERLRLIGEAQKAEAERLRKADELQAEDRRRYEAERQDAAVQHARRVRELGSNLHQGEQKILGTKPGAFGIFDPGVRAAAQDVLSRAKARIESIAAGAGARSPEEQERVLGDVAAEIQQETIARNKRSEALEVRAALKDGLIADDEAALYQQQIEEGKSVTAELVEKRKAAVADKTLEDTWNLTGQDVERAISDSGAPRENTIQALQAWNTAYAFRRQIDPGKVLPTIQQILAQPPKEVRDKQAIENQMRHEDQIGQAKAIFGALRKRKISPDQEAFAAGLMAAIAASPNADNGKLIELLTKIEPAAPGDPAKRAEAIAKLVASGDYTSEEAEKLVGQEGPAQFTPEERQEGDEVRQSVKNIGRGMAGFRNQRDPRISDYAASQGVTAIEEGTGNGKAAAPKVSQDAFLQRVGSGEFASVSEALNAYGEEIGADAVEAMSDEEAKALVEAIQAAMPKRERDQLRGH